jgi:hypothetical protein
MTIKKPAHHGSRHPSHDAWEDDGSTGAQICERRSILVHHVTHEDAQTASDSVELIRGRYGISDSDTDTLFGAFIAVFVRGKILSGN